MVAEVGSEPGVVGRFGRGPGWDIDLGRVRLGYDMVRIRVRCENRRLGEISHLFFRMAFKGSYTSQKEREQRVSVRPKW
jgi:hypothetical protein